VSPDSSLLGIPVRYMACVCAIFSGVSMVTNVLFWSGKSINLRRAIPFAAALAFVVVLLVVSSYPPGVLFGLFVCYGLSGYVMSIWRRLRRRKPAVANKAQ